MLVLSIILICYLIGAVPFAFITTHLITGKDVRKYGSGNVGATNASRLLGFKFGVLVALLDIFKGYIAVLIANLFLFDMPVYYFLLASLAVIIGHNWSVFLRFSGGKGVATTVGVLLRLLPIGFLIYALIWISVIILSKYVSLGSIMAAMSLPLIFFFYKEEAIYIVFAIIIALFVIARHYSNIKRLLKGKERKIKLSLSVNKGDV